MQEAEPVIAKNWVMSLPPAHDIFVALAVVIEPFEDGVLADLIEAESDDREGQRRLR